MASSSRKVTGTCRRGLQWTLYRSSSAAPTGKPPLFLIHGYACGMGDWGALPKMLSSRGGRDVAVFSHRGLDGSALVAAPDTAEPTTVADLAEDAASCLSSLGWSDGGAHVMGISLGGMVAQELALGRPGLVRGLVLGCTTHGGREATPPPPEFIDLCSSWAHHGSDVEDSGDDAQRSFASQFVDACSPPNCFATERSGGAKLREKMIDAFLLTRRNPCGLRQQFGALARFNSTKRLGGLSAPTLVVHGTADRCVPFANGESLAAKLPNARLLPWEGTPREGHNAVCDNGGAAGAGHFFWLDRPQELTEIISDFLAGHDDPAARL